MKRIDLRSKIIPTKINNTNCSIKDDNDEFITTDVIFLESYKERFKNLLNEEGTSVTDFALMHNARIYEEVFTRLNKRATWVWLRSSFSEHFVNTISAHRISW